MKLQNILEGGREFMECMKKLPHVLKEAATVENIPPLEVIPRLFMKPAHELSRIIAAEVISILIDSSPLRDYFNREEIPETGTQKNVLLIPGFMMSGGGMFALTDELKRNKCHIWTPSTRLVVSERSFKAVQAQVMEKLDEVYSEEKPVVIIGYSLGGNLLHMMADQIPDDVTMISFGADYAEKATFPYILRCLLGKGEKMGLSPRVISLRESSSLSNPFEETEDTRKTSIIPVLGVPYHYSINDPKVVSAIFQAIPGNFTQENE